MKMHKKGILLSLLVLLCINSGCEVEGKNSSTSENLFVSTSSSKISSTTSSIIDLTSILPNGLPKISQEFIDAVNEIVVDVNAGFAIANAFTLFESLPGDTWDYPEVLEAYNKLCLYEEEYNLIVSERKKIDLFLEKVSAFPNREDLTLNDEYLIIRAEDSYMKLSDELKSHPEVVSAYEVMLEYRELYEVMEANEIARKDEEDASLFLEFVNKIPDTELAYSYYFVIEEGMNMYSLLSEEAKAKDGVEEAYSKLSNAHNLINIKDGNGLFDVTIIHKANNWEAMLDIQAKDEKHKVTGDNKVFEFKVFEDGVAINDASLLKWGDSPSNTSYTRTNGIHSFSFTVKKYYVKKSQYTMSFIIETDAGENYAISLYYLVEGLFTCNGYTENEFYYNQLNGRVSSLLEKDYTEEDWKIIQNLLVDGSEKIKNATDSEEIKTIFNQYYDEITNVEKNFTTIEGAQVIEISSVETSKDNILDNKTGTSWQAATTTNEYFIIDLGQEYSMLGLSIIWQNSNAKEYSIKISNENNNWDSIESSYTYLNGVSGDRTDEIRFDQNVSGRYIRIDMVVSTTQWGFRIYEIDIYKNR